MKLKGLARGWTAVLCSIVLVGAGAMLVTPVANAVGGINWGHIWKTQIQPRADKRYYTKSQAKKKFAPKQKVIRGAFSILGVADNTGDVLSDNINFGFTLSSAPTVHYIPAGAPVPSGCSGTVAHPSAAAGNLCVFEANTLNADVRNTYSTTASTPGVGFCTAYGCGVYATAAAAGEVWSWGTWAVHPAGLAKRNSVPSVQQPSGKSFGR